MSHPLEAKGRKLQVAFHYGRSRAFSILKTRLEQASS